MGLSRKLKERLSTMLVTGRAPRPRPQAPAQKDLHPARDWDWFVGQVQEAREDRRSNLLHPGLAYAGLPAVGLAALLSLPLLLLIPVDDTPLVMDLVMPALIGGVVFLSEYCRRCYREAFIRVLAIERADFVEPHIPTGLLEVYLPKAAVADQPRKWRTTSGRPAFADPDAYLWLALKPGQTAEDIRSTADLLDLEVDDYRMEDVVNVERRALDRQVQSTGFLDAEVDKPKGEGAGTLMELLPYLTGIGFAVFGGIIAITVAGG